MRGLAVDAAILIWNRAALENGGVSPDPGDIALATALSFHGLVMNSGVLDAVERTSSEDLAQVEAAFRWLDLKPVAELLASVGREVGSGVLADEERAEALELAADRSYAAACRPTRS